MNLDGLIATLPKAELHVHIEGTLEPELMLELAARNGIELPYPDVDAARAAYQFTNLQTFLDIYYLGAAVLRTEDDFADLMAAYLQRAVAEGVARAEVFFDPQTHTERGVPIGTVIRGLERARRDFADRIDSALILSFLRHLPEESAFATLASAEPYLDRIIAVGLDSSEIGHPPEKFARVFARARSMGLKAVAHAGEEGPPDYVWGALDFLAAGRIDHGIRSLEDADLVRRLVQEQVPLTVCPQSNLKLRVVSSLSEHPVKRMLDLGLNVSIHSDDPAYFGAYLADNYRHAATALGLEADEITRLAENSIRSSFSAPINPTG